MKKQSNIDVRPRYRRTVQRCGMAAVLPEWLESTYGLRPRGSAGE